MYFHQSRFFRGDSDRGLFLYTWLSAQANMGSTDCLGIMFGHSHCEPKDLFLCYTVLCWLYQAQSASPAEEIYLSLHYTIHLYISPPWLNVYLLFLLFLSLICIFDLLHLCFVTFLFYELCININLCFNLTSLIPLIFQF